MAKVILSELRMCFDPGVIFGEVKENNQDIMAIKTLFSPTLEYLVSNISASLFLYSFFPLSFYTHSRFVHSFSDSSFCYSIRIWYFCTTSKLSLLKTQATCWQKPIILFRILAAVSNTAPFAPLREDLTATKNVTTSLSKRSLNNLSNNRLVF